MYIIEEKRVDVLQSMSRSYEVSVLKVLLFFLMSSLFTYSILCAKKNASRKT